MGCSVVPLEEDSGLALPLVHLPEGRLELVQLRRHLLGKVHLVGVVTWGWGESYEKLSKWIPFQLEFVQASATYWKYLVNVMVICEASYECYL